MGDSKVIDVTTSNKRRWIGMKMLILTLIMILGCWAEDSVKLIQERAEFIKVTVELLGTMQKFKQKAKYKKVTIE